MEQHEIPEPFRGAISAALAEITERRKAVLIAEGTARIEQRAMDSASARMKDVAALMIQLLGLPPGDDYEVSPDGATLKKRDA